MNLFTQKNIYIPAFVLSFIFCGAIVGETVSISLVVSALGSEVLSKLYLVNGILLYGLPLFFLGKIDRVDRGRFLSRQLLVISGVLICILIGMTFISQYNLPVKNIVLVLLYPFSYLTKTILFLTFWTLANDIFPTSEAKKTFPIIAAAGMAGGLAGACFARMIVNVYSAESVIILWGFSYVIAWYFAEKTRAKYKDRLRFREDLPSKPNDLISDASDVITIRIVRLMAVLYFAVFVAVFSVDYLFWEACHKRFITSEALVSFQFTFYLFHACAAIAGLWFAVPPLIRVFGFTKLFYCLPVVLLSGAVILLTLQINFNTKAFFIAFVVVQFLRYVIFENTFSPIYQMFFAAIEREKRGRAKTLLEGFVKPAAIICSGLLLMILGHNRILVLLLLILCSIVTIVVIVFLRKTYSQALIPEIVSRTEPGQIIANVSHYEIQKLSALVNEYGESSEPDMRIISILLYAKCGTIQSLEKTIEIFDRETNVRVKEMVAKSLSGYYWIQARPFVERLIDDPNSRIRANTLMSINKMNCHWKMHLKEKVQHLLFDGHLRVQVEAAKYLWNNTEPTEQESILAFYRSLLASQSLDRQSAGIYLTGEFQPKGWQQLLIDNLSSSSNQVFKKCVEVIMRSQEHDLKIEALKIIANLSREHVAVTGVVILKVGSSLWSVITAYFPECKSRRMIFELVRCLRIFADEIRSTGKRYHMSDDVAQTIYQWMLSEIESAYQDCYVRMQIGDDRTAEALCSILDQALRENQLRVCEWAVNAMVLLDRSGVFVWKYTDIDIRDMVQRMDLVEILESAGTDKIGMFVLPFLKNETWAVLGRIGNNSFRFNDEMGVAHVEYFLQSDNRWVVLCALRTMLYYTEELFQKTNVKETLQMLLHDSNKHVAVAVHDLLEKNTNEERLRSDAFILLEKVLFFKKTLLFRNVSAEKLMRLAEISQYAVFEKNTVISMQGEVSEQLYIVKNGSLSVVKSDGETTSEISVINEGETYGEIGLFTQSPRSASAITKGACELFIVKRSAFKKLLLEVPEISYNLLETMSDRLRQNADDIVELRKHSE